MMTLDDVRRVREILSDHCELIDSDILRSRFEDDGTLVWITASCSGECIHDLVDAGFDVYVWGSLSHSGFLQIDIK